MKSIYQIVDDSLQKMREQFFPMTGIIEEVPKEMIDLSLETEEDYIGWKAIPSQITDKELLEFEEELNCKLPNSYKHFLQYKYFMELHLQDVAIRLHHFFPKSKLEKLEKMNLDSSFSKEILRKGYFYFADFYDFGLLTFDTNQPKEENEFEIVFFMYDDLKNKYLYSKSFTELMNSDENQSNNFIERLNQLDKN
ncbi:MAG: SMI1/KNR4 family protein [Saprospiraceae bacterium]